jgi:hypothetical protein
MTGCSVYVKGSSGETGYVSMSAGIGNEFSVSVWAEGWPRLAGTGSHKRGESGGGFEFGSGRGGTNAVFTAHGR